MNPILKYINTLGYIIGIILIITFIMSVLNYFNIISNSVMNYYKFIIILLTPFIGGINIGNKASEKGWLEGLKLGFILVFILFLFTYLGLEKSLNLKNYIYYLIILIITMLGGMVGINKKETNE